VTFRDNLLFFVNSILVIVAIGMLRYAFRYHARILKPFWHYYWFARDPDIPEYRPISASELPGALHGVGEELVALGYVMVGPCVVDYKHTKPTPALVYHSSDGSIIATAMGERPLVEFDTLYNDNTAIITTYPTGENIESRELVAHFARKSVNAAHAYHRDRTAKARSAGKRPLIRFSLAEIQAAQPAHRQHTRLYHRRWARLGVCFSLLWLTVCVVLPCMLLAVVPYGDLQMSAAMFATWLGSVAVFYYVLSRLRRATVHPSGAIDDAA
jgi:hypothetical protein